MIVDIRAPGKIPNLLSTKCPKYAKEHPNKQIMATSPAAGADFEGGATDIHLRLGGIGATRVKRRALISLEDK